MSLFPTKTKAEKLREDIAILLSVCGYRHKVSPQNCLGCIGWDEINEICQDSKADPIIEAFTKAGGVLLSKDQTLPLPELSETNKDLRYTDAARRQGMRLMRQAGWKKVEPAQD